jgi:hypothetical protein
VCGTGQALKKSLLPTPSPVRVSGVKSAGYANIELLPR